MPDKSHQDTLHFLDAHIDMFDHISIQHACWHMLTTTLLLQLLQAPENHALTMAETILYIREIITQFSLRHVRLSPYPYAEDIATLCCYQDI